MLAQAEPLRNDQIESIVERVRERLEPERGEEVEGFVRRLFAQVPPRDLLRMSVDDLYGAALQLWSLMQQREPGELKVRVYNPRLDEHGWHSPHTVIEIVNDDMPFLVDSVMSELGRTDAEVRLLIHPVVDAIRDDDGALLSIHEGDERPDDRIVESVMHIQVRAQPESRHAKLAASLQEVLADVRDAIVDWQPMRDRLTHIVDEIRANPPALPADEVETGLEFLEWLDDEHFTYLGYREYTFDGDGEAAVARIHSERSLGILRNDDVAVFDGLRSLGKLPNEVRDFIHAPRLLRVTKGNRRSRVHRPVALDTIAIKKTSPDGTVVGERLFVGLFTSTAYSAPPHQVPLLRNKVDAVLERADFGLSSHAGKRLMHILATYPRDELFQIDEDTLFRIAVGILNLQERSRIAFFPRIDPFERFASCLVYAPRDRYDTALRLKFQDILATAFGGTLAAHYAYVTDGPLARLHFVIDTQPGRIPPVDFEAVEQQLVEAGRSWNDDLEHALIESRGEEEGVQIFTRYADAFPAAYRERYNGATAVRDIERIEQVISDDDVAMHLYRPLEAQPCEVRMKLYVHGRQVPLSEVLPMLEDMGLEVIGEVPFRIRVADADASVWLREFDMRTTGEIDLAAVRSTFHDAFRRIWHRVLESDGFNQLVLLAGLSAREVTVLRAYCKYLRQARIPFSLDYMADTLARNPKSARLLVDLFLARFDPAATADRTAEGRRIEREIETLLEGIANLDEDRIIRRFLDIVQCTLRTNFFQRTEDGSPKDYLSLKIDSTRVMNLPLPRPMREIFVYSARVEAIHLRGGLVARGGIRWSDRREDFRTEVLGLMKAQMVKNAVIVPVGSKGGFVCKCLPDGPREAVQAEVIDCYSTLMRGMLDITDNLDGDKVVPPRDVVRLDADDPYLVVAADKGTATFSDTANGISEEYGFWLGDAFASGGSVGYDHKAMGITAKGAWESVKRHFRETGKDIQNEDFVVVGCGDMSGDVFGNGMLLSKHIRLVAAFNHMHVFVDPNPDAATSWDERKRMFDLPRSTWDDYDRSLISEGGGIFERSAKSIPLTPQMQELFGLTDEAVTPNELITAILKAPAELLWLGGIGTYVRASDESHGDVGDRANDSIRVAARELRARVVGEGANLGLTQRARIEASRCGVRLNTDFIDNSAGVDCSDHEVNIKILLGEIERAGDITRKQRNETLREMTDEVGDLVLRDNYLQTQTLSVTHGMSGHLMDRLGRFMKALEKSGRLDRKIEFLPDDEELAERLKSGRGFTRPELCVLLSYAKIALYEELMNSNLPDSPYLAKDLAAYFPSALRERFRTAIDRHRLRREIIATVVTNELINRVGISFVYEVQEKTGLAASDIARAFVVARDITGVAALWHRIEALDNQVSTAVQARLLAECGRLTEKVTVWLLRQSGPGVAIASQIELYGGGVARLAESIEDFMAPSHREELEVRTELFEGERTPDDLARQIARLPWLASACDIVRIAHGSDRSVDEVATLYFRVGSRFGFDWLRTASAALPSDSVWDKLAVTAMVDDLYELQTEFTNHVLQAATSEDLVAEELISTWISSRAPLVQRCEQLLIELESTAQADLAMLAVASRQLKSVLLAS